MISFSFLPKERANVFLPKLFDILHVNMNHIAPTGMTYEEDLNEWIGAVAPALEKDPRQIILISDGDKTVGFFQYYVNDSTFMMEEIQFLPEYQGKGVFQKLYAHLAEIIPQNIPLVEAYAHKSNLKSQGILKHLGLESIGESKNGNNYHFCGDCQKMLNIFKEIKMTEYKWTKGDVPRGIEVRQVYGIVFSDDGRILLRIEDGKYKLTGGKPEGDETYEQTLIREYLEEVNVELKNCRYLGYLLVNDDNGEQYAQVRMIAKIKRIGENRPDIDNGKTYGRLLVTPEKAKILLNYKDEAGNTMLDDAVKTAGEVYGKQKSVPE